MFTNFEQINALYRRGINICKGCKYEHAAACTPARLAEECEKQYLHYQETTRIQPKNNPDSPKNNPNGRRGTNRK